MMGAAGVGKSELARRATIDLAERGMHVVRVIASPATRHLPLGALVRLLPDEQPLPERGVDALRVVTDAIVARAPERLLLSIDDAHDLDPQSAWVVRDLVANQAAALLATVRSGAPCPEDVDALWTDGMAERVELAEFDRATAARFTDRVLGGPAHPSLQERVWDLSRGNALYLRETLLGGRDSGAIATIDGMWAAVGTIPTTPRLVDVVERRLASLDPAEREGLELVAVAGLLEVDVAEALIPADALAALERSGHLRVDEGDPHLSDRRRVNGTAADVHRDDRAGGERVRTSHPVVAEALRTAMPLSRYRKICRTLATVLADRGTAQGAGVLRVATWQLEGGTVDPDVLASAANAARFAGDHALAERLARTAWEHGRVFAAASVLIAVLGYLGRHEEAAEWATAIDGQDLTEEQRTSLEILRAETYFWGLGRADDARRVIGDALGHIEHPDRRNQLLSARAAYDMLAGRTTEALATTYELATGDSDRTVAATALSSAGSLVLVGRPVEAWTVAQRGIDARLAVADTPRTTEFGLLLVAQIMAATAAGWFDEGEALGRAAHEIAVKANTPLGQGFLGMLLGRLLTQRGRAAEGDRWLHDAYLRFGDGGYEGAQRWCLGARAFAHAYRGDASGAQRHIAEAGRLRPRELHMMEPEMLRADAWARATAGDHRGATDTLVAAADLAVEMESVMHELAARHDLIRLGIRDKQAGMALEELGRQVEGPLAAAQTAHGRAWRTADAAALADVADAFADLGADLLAAEAAAQAAACARGDGDRRAAIAHERRARSIADTCGAVATPALASLADPERWRLTRREREVADLAATGRSTKEIAAHLVVSPRTVENHLHRVYRKLGVSGKHELRADALGDDTDR